jgi:hypothetical protein
MAETFTYGLFNRPAMYGAVPAGFTNAQDNKEFAYGTIDYDHRLTDEEIYRYELARFSPNTFDLPIGATVERLDAGEDGYTIIRYYRGRYILAHKATGDEEYSVKVSDVRAIAAPAAVVEPQDATSEPTPEDGFERPCERCDGSGTVTSSGLYIVPCPECYGTGIHTEPEPTELDALRTENETLRAQLAAARANLAITQKALEAIASNYVGDRTPASIAGDALIQSNYYVDALNK